jgi:hypothetical protein
MGLYAIESDISGSTALLTTAVLFTDDWISVPNHLFFSCGATTTSPEGRSPKTLEGLLYS